ncbi:MAG: hypothetical protein IKJ00_02050, partial [Clostridia bacterium]|nr:hypothetical protein [Clostridia bacterium]
MKKLKLLTRALALLLSLLMVVSIVACANDEETEETDDVSVTVDTAEGDEKLELPDVNYDGAPFTILGRSGSNSEYMKDLDISELTAESDSVDKAVYQRNRTVEEAYGVEIILIAEEETKLNSTVMNSVSSGDDTYDIIATQGRYVFQFIVGNNASEIHDFEY